MIEIFNLQKVYNSKIVLDIPSLHIKRGEVAGLVGNNGQGKSTLLKLILDLIKPSKGQAFLNRKNVREYEGWKEFTGSYLDESYLISYLKVEEYFDFIAFLNEVDNQTLKIRLSLFDDFFKGEIMQQKKYIGDFSTGNKCKIGIAAAFLNRPKLIIFDEPFAHLDPSSQNFLKFFIKQYQSSEGATFFISSHQIEAVTEVSDRIIVLEKGRIISDIQNNEDSLGLIKNILA